MAYENLFCKYLAAYFFIQMRRIFQSPVGIVIAILLVLLIEYYSFVAVRVAFRNKTASTKLIITVVYILLNVVFYVTLFNARNLSQPGQDSFLAKYFVAIMMGVLFTKVVLTLFLFLGDVYRLFAWIFTSKSEAKLATDTPVNFNKKTIPRSQFLSQIALLTGSAIIGTFLYGTRNKYNYQVKNVKLNFPHLPEKFNGLKIVHISDIHAGSFDSPEDVLRGMKLIMKQQPDIILFTGDIVNNISTELLPYKDIFKTLSAPLGVFAVLGNHDYGDYQEWPNPEEKADNMVQLKQHFEDMNWELLLNKNVVFDKYGDRLAIIGVENWGSKVGFPKYGKMADAYKGVIEDGATFKILMSHDPSHWDSEIITQYKDVDLTLSGHTHGMQFGVKLPWFQWSPVQYVYKHWMGLYQEGNQYLYVNPGFGFIGYKGRVGILPEITVLELFRG